MKYFYIITLLFLNYIQGNDNSSTLTINTSIRSEAIIAIDSQTHIDYGLSYPITYEFTIPSGSYDLRSYRKFQYNQEWSQILEQTSNDFFNGIEAVRFDYDNNIAYVSIGFSDISDSIFIKITNNESNIIESTYSQMSQYYDNRDAVVTSTADDWAYWNNNKFVRTCRNFRSFNLWLSCAIVTDGADANTWIDIQTQLDSGYVEAVSHSRTHPYIPYIDVEGEVLGSMEDLIENLDLPAYNRYGNHEYIYAWVAPYGEYDESIDSMVSVAQYLITRMYHGDDNSFSDWNQELFKYDPVGVTTEVGPLWLGTTDTIELKNSFDDVLSNGGIYHLVSHPNILEWDQDYPWVHLEHISNRKNVWYTGFGHLYAYHFLQASYTSIDLKSENENVPVPQIVKLHQNYPNPFNPKTIISYQLEDLAYVNIDIVDLLGQRIKTLTSGYQNSGQSTIGWDATDDFGKIVPGGIYFYRLSMGNVVKTKKMLLLK